MRYYFLLQYRRMLRFFGANGLNPIIGVSLVVAVFIALSYYLIHQIEYGEWYLALIGLGLSFQASSENHRDFLLSLFNKSAVLKIRFAESLLICSPFMLIEIANANWGVSCVIFVVVVLLPLVPISNRKNVAIPTPFGKLPYELPVGFRSTILAFPLAVAPVLIGLQVNNPNLMMASFLILTLAIMSFGYQPEPKEYIWMHQRSPSQFLWYKLRLTLIASQSILLPFSTLLIVLSSADWIIVILIHLIATLFILALRLAKYSAYPNEIGVAQALLLGLCFWFPPLLLVVVPKFFKDGKQRLTPLLT